MSINTLRPHKANSRPGNCTRPLEAETLDKLKPQKKNNRSCQSNQMKSRNSNTGVGIFTCCTEKSGGSGCLSMLGVPWPLLGPTGRTEQLGGRGSDASAPLPPHSQHRAAQLSPALELQVQSPTLADSHPNQAFIPAAGLGGVLTICPVQGNWPGTRRKAGRAPVQCPLGIPWEHLVAGTCPQRPGLYLEERGKQSQPLFQLYTAFAHPFLAQLTPLPLSLGCSSHQHLI